MSLEQIKQVVGRGVYVPGDDIDTDQIIPARFLMCVTFDALGGQLFYDARFGANGEPKGVHPLNDERFTGAKVLLVNANFGCGSSREHAPQSIHKAGFRAIVGESFAEIFFGNCVSLGIPCATVDEASIAKVQAAAEKDPSAEWTLDVEKSELRGPVTVPVTFPDGPRQQFLTGKWNPMSELLANLPKVEKVAAGLPYVSGRW